MRGPAWKVAAALVVLSVTCVAADYTPPTYVVDVGLPPKQRWTQAISGVVAAHGWEGSFGTLLGWARSIPFFPELLDIINPIFEDVLPYMGEYGGEIEVRRSRQSALHLAPFSLRSLLLGRRACGRHCNRCTQT